MPKDQGLSDDAIAEETAVVLPERDALSIVAGAKLVPIATIAPEPQPADTDVAPVETPPSSR
jgi:hypothetical protein